MADKAKRAGSNRRQFLASAGAAASVAALGSAARGNPRRAIRTERLAIEGGTPVRKQQLHWRPYGPQFYDDVERNELLGVLNSKQPFRWWKSGSKTLEFEKAYAQYIGVKHALGVTSGTTALFTAMAALEIGPGDEVIVPAWNWYADYDTVVLSGALPIFAEIDESFNLDPEDFEKKITPRTKAVIPTHLQGNPCDMDPIMEIARNHGVKVLEDLSQCVGGKYKGKYLGSIGDIGINSFQLSKTITSGEGGAVVTDETKLFERAILFHDVGTLRTPYREQLKGGLIPAFASCNFRMNEFTGAVLKAQLTKLEMICTRLRSKAKKVREAIAELPGIKLRKLPDPEGDIGSTVYIDCGRRERRDWFLRALAAEGIAAVGPVGSVILPIDKRIENKVTVHPKWPTFNTARGRSIQYGAACCPRTIDIIGRFGGTILDPNFSDEDLNDIIHAFRKVYLAMGRA